jgi:hypothetical protein
MAVAGARARLGLAAARPLAARARQGRVAVDPASMRHIFWIWRYLVLPSELLQPPLAPKIRNVIQKFWGTLKLQAHMRFYTYVISYYILASVKFGREMYLSPLHKLGSYKSPGPPENTHK